MTPTRTTTSNGCSLSNGSPPSSTFSADNNHHSNGPADSGQQQQIKNLKENIQTMASNCANGQQTQAQASQTLATQISPSPTATNSLTNTEDSGSNSNSNSDTQTQTSKCNLTLVLREKLNMKLEQRPLPPKPKGNEVTLATHTVGICGSDVKYWREGKIGNFILNQPMILGHETSAIVIETGDDVKNLRPGDKVAVEVGLPCSTCSLCKTGKYNLCNQMAFAATPPYDGTLTRYFNHPSDFCYKLPEAVSLEEGALLEPLAVAVHACQRAPIKINDIVLVCGAGAVGVLSMLSAKAFGASHVIITDISASRLQFARQLGASATYLCERGTSIEEMSSDLRKIVAKLRSVAQDNRSDSLGVNVALECSGAESSLNLALQSVTVGGTIVCVGCQPDTVTVSLNAAITQEIDIKGVFRYRNCYPLALSLVETGRINLRPLVTHRFRLEDSVQAFETCCRGEGVKIMIKCMDDRLKLLDNSSTHPSLGTGGQSNGNHSQLQAGCC